MEMVSSGMNMLFGKVIREPIKAIACLVGAAFICWRLLLLSLVIAPLAALVIHWLAKSLKRANRRAMEEMAQLYSTLEETFRGIKVVKAFAMERYERRRFHRNSKHYFRKAMKIARYDSLMRPMAEVMGIVTICLALLAGAYLVLNGETHLLGIRMSARPLSLASLLVFYGLLAGHGRSDPKTVGSVHAAAAGVGGQRPDLRDARPRVAGPGSQEAPAARPAPSRSRV